MRRWKKAVLGILVVLATLELRAIFESRRELQIAGDLVQKTLWNEAILHFDRAAHWYAPLNPNVLRALDRLQELGQKFESENPDLALLAYDAARGSIYAIRGLNSPYSERLPWFNERIARLRSAQEKKTNPTADVNDRYRFHLHLLEKDERPGRLWSLIVGLSFLGWVGSVIAFIWYGFDQRGRLQRQKALPWAVGGVVSFCLWIVGLISA